MRAVGRGHRCNSNLHAAGASWGEARAAGAWALQALIVGSHPGTQRFGRHHRDLR